jgi:hypothetical protein
MSDNRNLSLVRGPTSNSMEYLRKPYYYKYCRLSQSREKRLFVG